MTEDAERLARIEASLAHVVKAVDRAAKYRESTLERLARVEERVGHIEKQMPQVTKNTKHNAESEGWREAKQDAELDGRARIAIGVSVLALITSAASAIFKWVQG